MAQPLPGAGRDERSATVADLLPGLPDEPGVYKFYDAHGTLLYVGKATSLRNRVRSYFQKTEALDPKKRQMVSEIADIQYLLAQTPAQSLVWEADLVRSERPRYNVKLRDDKHYPYIRINVQDPWPKTTVARRMERDGSRYFGPFTDSTSVRHTLDTVNRLFPHILCTRVITGQDPRACLYYHIKRCPAPCIGAIDNGDYRGIIDQMVSFLDGKSSQVVEDMRLAMEGAAEDLQFERAADLRDRIRAAEKVVGQQQIIYTSTADEDAIGLYTEGPFSCVQVFLIREGRLVGREHFVLEGQGEETQQEVLSSFLTQFYSQATEIPREILLPVAIDDADTVAAWLTQRRGEQLSDHAQTGAEAAGFEGTAGASPDPMTSWTNGMDRGNPKRGRPARKVTLLTPRQGERRKLIELASQNAREVLGKLQVQWLADLERTTGAVVELGELLDLPQLPHRIECYDISHVQGTHQVASMVVFENGQPKRSAYRKFKIKHEEGNNDFLSMQEVIGRRFKRALTGQLRDRGEEGTWEESSQQDRGPWSEMPDLVIIDGGKGQLNAALEILDAMEITELPVVGLAKENEEIYSRERATGRAAQNPVLLPRTSQALYLVQRIRDEAHRFAITFHRSVRAKSSIRSSLDDVQGIGPKRKRELLRRFGSVKGIKAASLEELAAVPGMTIPQARRLHTSL
ncbi:MAG: excinuclease ABC subunit UvrC [Chloroflexi bacterium]|nr:excinuclease ABC subunit UvrC [Chloroflexota bacterium]